ncbi:MAG: FGGY-family carbohydrate kinase, partial [Gemmatimonadota bacterium]
PWYVGERTPDLPLAAPVSFGFGVDDFTPAVLCRAVLEGHVLNLYDGFARMPVTPREIRLTGGLSRSPSWSQTIADIFGAEAVPVEGEGAALGAAIHAAWVGGREEGRGQPLKEVVAPFVVLDEDRRRRPRAEARPAVELLRRLYRSVSRRIRGEEAEDPFALRHDLRRLTPGGDA